jgi:hypothetical protein
VKKANPAGPYPSLRLPGDIARVALTAFGLIAAAVTVIAIVESYSNLLAFARDHGLAGWRAAIAPGAADSFIIMGELLLFAAILLRWGKLPHALGAGMAIWGFLLSLGGNIWHAAAATPLDRAVAGIWPVTATAGLAGGLIIVRQIVMASGAPAAPRGEGTGTPLPPPAPSREETGLVSSRGARRAPGRTAAALVPADGAAEPARIDVALLKELLTSPEMLKRSVRSLSLEKAGIQRSRTVERTLEEARRRMNGGGHD